MQAQMKTRVLPKRMRGEPPAGEAEAKKLEPISLVDKDLQPKQLSKSGLGWFTTANHPYLLAAH